MEVLSQIILAWVQNGFMVAGFLMVASSRGYLNIFHLSFADDTLFFYEAKHNQIWALRTTLLCSKAVLSL